VEDHQLATARYTRRCFGALLLILASQWGGAAISCFSAQGLEFLIPAAICGAFSLGAFLAGLHFLIVPHR
jgi:hypothetical protein